MGGSKRFAGALIVATLVLTGLTLAATPASALSSQESQFTSLINKERSSRSIRTLTVYSDLVAVARRHSARMAEKGTIWHNPNLGTEVSGWTVVGENVGMGGTVSDLHQAFMNSPGHRANILDREYNQIGVGVVVKDGTIYVTEVFAQRKTATKTTTTTTTTTRQTTTTTRPRSTAPAPRPAAAKPAPKPAPRPAAPVVASRSVDVLVQLLGLDANSVDPATGQALGV